MANFPNKELVAVRTQIGSDFEISYHHNGALVRALASLQYGGEFISVFVVISIDDTQIVRYLSVDAHPSGTTTFNPYWPQQTSSLVFPVIASVTGEKTTTMPFWNDLFQRLLNASNDTHTSTFSNVKAALNSAAPAGVNAGQAYENGEIYPYYLQNWSKIQKRIGPKQTPKILEEYDNKRLKWLNENHKTVNFTSEPSRAKTIIFQ